MQIKLMMILIKIQIKKLIMMQIQIKKLIMMQKINDDIDKDTDKEINNDVDKIKDGNTEEVIDDIIKTKKEINDDTEKVSNDANVTNEEIIDDNTEKIIDDNTNKTDEEIDDDTEETVYLKMLNKMITKVNEFKQAEFTYASCFDKINKILIEIKEGNTCDDEIYEDPWLKLNELYGINKLFDKFFDKIWKLASDKNRKVDKKININKYLKIDKYTDKYTDITNGKLDLFNNTGSILAKATSKIQNEAYIVNDLKQNENADINMLKITHCTLEKALIKWMKTMSKTFKNDKFSKYDMKADRPTNKKDKKKNRKRIKPDTKLVIKPVIKKILSQILKKIRTCSGEVFFTNEHKAVFSKNKAKTYIDINDLQIFKDFSKDNKTKFKKKPKTEIETVTTETIKIITAKKDKKY